MGKILRLSLKLNFIPNTLGCNGLIRFPLTDVCLVEWTDIRYGWRCTVPCDTRTSADLPLPLFIDSQRKIRQLKLIVASDSVAARCSRVEIASRDVAKSARVRNHTWRNATQLKRRRTKKVIALEASPGLAPARQPRLGLGLVFHSLGLNYPRNVPFGFKCCSIMHSQSAESNDCRNASGWQTVARYLLTNSQGTIEKI